MLTRKTYKLGADALKALASSDDGRGRIKFAKLNVIDHDGDWIPAGSIGEQVAHIMPMHSWKDADPPFLGVARTSEQDGYAIADLEINTDLPRAQHWRSALKFALDRGLNVEWSYGFEFQNDPQLAAEKGAKRALKNQRVIEVSPVVMGAGLETGTLEMKSRELDQKAWAELAGSWEAAQEAIRTAAHALLLGEDDGWVSIQATFSDRVIVGEYRYDDGDGRTERFWQFSWTAGADGEVRLGDQAEVEFSVVVQEKQISYADQFFRLIQEGQAFVARSKALAALRVEQGRNLSRTYKERLQRLAVDLEALMAETDSKGQTVEPEATGAPAERSDPGDSQKDAELEPDGDGSALFGRYLQIQSELAGNISTGENHDSEK